MEWEQRIRGGLMLAAAAASLSAAALKGLATTNRGQTIGSDEAMHWAARGKECNAKTLRISKADGASPARPDSWAGAMTATCKTHASTGWSWE